MRIKAIVMMSSSIPSVVSSFICKGIGSIPLPARRSLGRFLGTVASSLFLAREKEIILLQLKKFLPEHAHEQTVSKIFSHFAATIFESINTQPILQHGHFRFISQSGVTAEEITSLHHGALALTAHFGNWDLLGGYFRSLNVPLFTIGRRARNKIAQALIEQIRKDNGITTLWRNDEKGAREIVSLFRDGKIVAALIDQDTQVRSDYIPFFGVPVKTPTGIIELAQRFKRPVYTAFLAVEDNNTYTIAIERVPENLSEKEVLLFYHKQLESMIKRYPTQWVWFHKRWRSCPQNGTRSKDEYLNWLRSYVGSFLGILIGIFVSLHGTGCTPYESLARQAQKQGEQGNIDEAIALYKQHIEDRQEDSSKETWENPAFYYLFIGDLELKRNNITEAIAAYTTAHDHGVEEPLYLDRIRNVALVLETQGKYEEVLTLLTPLSQKDPLLINEILDRTSKKLLQPK